MTWGSAQAGNRAGKTMRCLQWQESGPECLAVTAVVDKWSNSTCVLLCVHITWFKSKDMNCTIEWEAITLDRLLAALIRHNNMCTAACSTQIVSICLFQGRVVVSLHTQLLRYRFDFPTGWSPVLFKWYVGLSLHSILTWASAYCILRPVQLRSLQWKLTVCGLWMVGE